MGERPHMASTINSLANYSAAIPSGPVDPDAPKAGSFLAQFVLYTVSLRQAFLDRLKKLNDEKLKLREK